MKITKKQRARASYSNRCAKQIGGYVKSQSFHISYCAARYSSIPGFSGRQTSANMSFCRAALRNDTRKPSECMPPIQYHGQLNFILARDSGRDLPAGSAVEWIGPVKVGLVQRWKGQISYRS
jgi:hypothetical protein